MKLYERYLKGETESVYNDIYILGEYAFAPDHFVEIDKVLSETFNRVRKNLEIIYQELLRIQYKFKNDFQYNFEIPLHTPLSNTEELLNKLDSVVKTYGFVPLSLKYFYKIVGGVNFGWDYDADYNLIWNLADPIQVTSLDGLVESVTKEEWHDDMQYYLDEYGEISLEISADEYHKDNISGGPPYSIQITKDRSIDSNLLNEPNNTTFINYLRICNESCGFPGLERNAHINNEYEDFFLTVKPKLLKI